MRLYLGESDEGLELSGGDGCAVWTLAVLAKLQVELLERWRRSYMYVTMYFTTTLLWQQTILAADFS